MILSINKVNLIPVHSIPQKGKARKGQKEIQSLLKITNQEREKNLKQKKSRETIELHKQHIKNLSDTQLTAEQINLLSRGLKFTYHERKPDNPPATFRLQPIC